MKKISIIYVYYNTPQEIVKSLASLDKAVGRHDYEVIIVNNNSPKPLPKIDLRNLTVINFPENLGFGKAINKAAAKAVGKYLAVINPDTVLDKNSIDLLVRKMESNSKTGIIGPQMRDAKGRFLLTTSKFPFFPTVLFAFSFINKIFPNNYFSKNYYLHDVDKDKEFEPDVLGGACFVIRKSLFTKIRGMDERFFMYFEESDLCYRVKKAGYSVLYYPKSKIVHFVGRSTSDKKWIESVFQKSRFLFLRKYQGLPVALLSEGLLRLSKPSNLLLSGILLVSLFANLYRITDLMLFIGDQGRDYLAALDMIQGKSFPLVGIPSSVTWLHQGPLSIYIIGIGLLLGAGNPTVPAILYGILGVATTYLVFVLGRKFFSTRVGLLSAILYATAPIIVINARMPYHTATIPLWAGLCFLYLYKGIVEKRRNIYYSFFFMGLLLQVELSNFVVLPIIVIILLIKKVRLTIKEIVISFFAFCIGILPFILHDITHKFTQIVGLFAWSLNRAGLFFGVEVHGEATTGNAFNAIERIYQQIAGIVYPDSLGVVWLIIGLMLLGFASSYLFFKKTSILIIMLWLILPIIGFLIHTAPGVAYFPLIYIPLAIFIAYSAMSINYQNFRQGIVAALIVVAFLNLRSTIQSDFYVNTKYRSNPLPPFEYNYGLTIRHQIEAVDAIVKDANGGPINLQAGGFLATLKTGLDNYQYLFRYKDVVLDSSSGKKYVIYLDQSEIKSGMNVIFRGNGLFVVRHD